MSINKKISWVGGITMKYQIFGTVMPMIEIELQRGETVYSQSGAMQWMDEAI